MVTLRGQVAVILCCPFYLDVQVKSDRRYLDPAIVFPLSPWLLSTQTPPLDGRCPTPPKMNRDCGFLGGLISENNGLLGPCVSYGARL